MASIRKRKLPSGKQVWQVDYRDQAGRRRHKQLGTKREADAFMVRARAEVFAGTHTPDAASTTVAGAAALWLEACTANGLESTSIAAYRQHVDLHIIPFLGRMKLNQLNVATIRDFEDKLKNGKPAPDGETRSRSSDMVKRVLRSLGTLIADAQERGNVGRNIVRELRSTRRRGQERRAVRRLKGRLKVGVDIPSPQEIKLFIEGLRDDRWRPLFLTAILTGLRASELRGLRWQDIEFRRAELHVRQRADARHVIGPLKSETSERTVPLPDLLVTTLKAWKLACPKGELGLVFPNGVGKVESHANIVKRGLQPLMVHVGLSTPRLDDAGRPIRIDGRPVVEAKYGGLHAFRHFYASWLINRRIDGGHELPAKLVQERLGHSTITLTMDRYGHLFPRGDDTAEMSAAMAALLT